MAFPGILPVVTGVQFNGSAQILAVRLQLNHYFVGTDFGLVVIVGLDGSGVAFGVWRRRTTGLFLG